MDCDDQGFTDQFGAELTYPEEQYDLDHIEDLWHLRTVVEGADIPDKV